MRSGKHGARTPTAPTRTHGICEEHHPYVSERREEVDTASCQGRGSPPLRPTGSFLPRIVAGRYDVQGNTDGIFAEHRGWAPGRFFGLTPVEK